MVMLASVWCRLSVALTVRVYHVFSSKSSGAADVSGVPGEANAAVLHLLHVDHHHSLGGLSWTALVHGLHDEGPLSLGQIPQWLGGLDLTSQGVDAEALDRHGETVKNGTVGSEVFILGLHGGQNPLGTPAGHLDDQRILEEEGGVVVDVQDEVLMW
ncbi:hypothetical protein EYF80_042834 [Liparis tanakae]|uniref:Secreted protein n=1 Tax=Liparis tanakae TaxID=230148 RepID=A0A4Z2G229_9TELE|nr:hypothetical protein EYF80_042834 [Liparis tanakae]